MAEYTAFEGGEIEDDPAKIPPGGKTPWGKYKQEMFDGDIDQFENAIAKNIGPEREPEP